MSAVNVDHRPSCRGSLRQAFHKRRRVIVNVVDPESIIDELIEGHVVDVTEWKELQSVTDVSERCSRLFMLIDSGCSTVPAADDDDDADVNGYAAAGDNDYDDDGVYQKLRLALKRTPSYGWIVDEIDETYEKLMSSQQILDRTQQAETEMLKIIAKIESNHAKILEFERRRFERRIRKLTLQLEEERYKTNNFPEKNSEWSGGSEVSMSVREAQFRVAVIADSENDQQLSSMYSFGVGKPICSMTSLHNELFVARTDLSDVEVYDVYSFNRLRTQSVRGLGVAADMASCVHRRCVYIADQLHGVVHTITTRRPEAAESGVVEVRQWPVGDRPAGLSVNSSTNILVACPDSRRIKEFSSKGRPLRSTQLSMDFVNVTHAVQLASDRLVVSHSTDSLCRICIVDAEGNVLRSYGGRRGSGRGQLDSPIRIAVCGFVFVLDFGNRRVLRLGPSLRGAREVISTGSAGLNWPLRMWLDDELGRLYVADNSSDKVRYIDGQIKAFAIADDH